MEQFLHFFKAGGFAMYPLAFLSILAFYVIVDRVIAYNQIGGRTKGLLDGVLERVQMGDISGAQKLLEKKTGVMADCLRVAIEYRHLSVTQVEKIIQEVGEEQFVELEAKLPVLDTTTTISPLIGLLGTLIGMIGTFQAISASANKGANDQILAGVGEALYATATGLSIAVIAFITYNYFASRQRTIVTQTELATTKLLNTFAEMEFEGKPIDDHKGVARAV